MAGRPSQEYRIVCANSMCMHPVCVQILCSFGRVGGHRIGFAIIRCMAKFPQYVFDSKKANSMKSIDSTSSLQTDLASTPTENFHNTGCLLKYVAF